MSYLYQIKNKARINMLEEMGFDHLPKELYGTEEAPNILYKIVQQPLNGQCVETLINFYQKLANEICSDRQARRAHAAMGIKYKWQNGAYKLVVTPTLKEMFTLWRLEMDFETGEVYFTISDGNMPRFYDAEQVMEKYCKEEIDSLLLNNIIEKVEYIPES